MAGIDKQRVRQAFTLHAAEYEAYSAVQKRVIDRLGDRLRGMSGKPARVLDIGSGTGMLLRVMADLYPEAELTGLDLSFGMSVQTRSGLSAGNCARLVNGDAEALPFGGNAFDLIVSTSTFQWLEGLGRAFAEAFRVLAPGGRFIFALFGGDTLQELRGSYRNAWEMSGHGSEERVQSFHSRERVEAEMVRAGFSDLRIWHEPEVEYHPDVPALIRSLKRIGAGSTRPVKSRGLAERGIMLRMMELYRRQYAVNGLIPATYEVIYGEAGKGSGSVSVKSISEP